MGGHVFPPYQKKVSCTKISPQRCKIREHIAGQSHCQRLEVVREQYDTMSNDVTIPYRDNIFHTVIQNKIIKFRGLSDVAGDIRFSFKAKHPSTAH